MITTLIIGPQSLGYTPKLKEIIGCNSVHVVRFDLGPLLQGEIMVAGVKSANNLFMSSFKVKRL